jgi:hypothetical protein
LAKWLPDTKSETETVFSPDELATWEKIVKFKQGEIPPPSAFSWEIDIFLNELLPERVKADDWRNRAKEALHATVYALLKYDYPESELTTPAYLSAAIETVVYLIDNWDRDLSPEVIAEVEKLEKQMLREAN